MGRPDVEGERGGGEEMWIRDGGEGWDEGWAREEPGWEYRVWSKGDSGENIAEGLRSTAVGISAGG